MTLTPLQTFIIICIVAAGTIITRFLPFFLFNSKKKRHSYIDYLGKVLPYAAMGLLVVYCLRNVSISSSPHGIPEALAIVFIAAVHYWRENTLLSIGAGTVVYMVLVQAVFI